MGISYGTNRPVPTWLLVIVTALLLQSSQVIGQQIQQIVKVRPFPEEGPAVAYRSREIQRQCLRLRLQAGTEIRSISVVLDGPAGYSGLLEIFGHEGGTIAPRAAKSLVEAVPLVKSVDGYETVVVPFSEAPRHSGGQLFVSVRDLSPHAYLLCYGREAASTCTEENGSGRYASIQQLRSGQWRSTGFIPLISLDLVVPSHCRGGFVLDTTLIVDVQRGEKSTYLSSFDLGGDGNVDLASGGYLFMNVGGGFKRGDFGPDAYLFGYDIDENPGDELVMMTRSMAQNLAVYRLTRNGELELRENIELPIGLSVSSMTQLDFNRDGRNDLALAGWCKQESEAQLLLYITDDRAGHWERIPIMGSMKTIANAEVSGPTIQRLPKAVSASISNLVAPASILVRTLESDLVMTFDQNGHLLERLEIPGHMQIDSHVRPSFVRDSLAFLPEATMHDAPFDEYQVSALLSEQAMSLGGGLVRRGPDHEVALESVVCADIDNDGHDEVFAFAHGPCRFLRVFYTSEGHFRDMTEEVMLSDVDDCRDGTFADLDHDGRLDFITIRRDKLQVYMNRLTVQPSGIKTLIGPVDRVAVLSNDRVTVRSNLVSGRGSLIQDACYIQTATRNDTAVVCWTEDSRSIETFHPDSPVIVAGRGRALQMAAPARSLDVRCASAGVFVSSSDVPCSTDVALYTVNGMMIGNVKAELSRKGEMYMSFEDLFGISTLSAGTYYVNVTTTGAASSCSFVIYR